MYYFLFQLYIDSFLKFTVQAQVMHNLPNTIYYMGFKDELIVANTIYEITLKNL